MGVMAKLTQEGIRDLARELVQGNPQGIRYKVLVNRIATDHPETPINTIHGSVWDLGTRYPNEISKPSRGLYVPITNASAPSPESSKVVTASKLKEMEFYGPFADWLKNELDEATDALPLGGSSLRNKWGTPDVVGVYKPSAADRIKFTPEIVSAEIKIDPQEPVVAFGQGVAYRLFSTKSYVVMPSTMSPEDSDRLEALCLLYGIGLVLFDLSPQKPDFQIRVRAQRFEPDMFYVNEFAERLFKTDPKAFAELFR